MGLFSKKYCGVCGEEIKGQYWYRKHPDFPGNEKKALYLMCHKCHDNWGTITLGGYEKWPLDPKEAKERIEKELEVLNKVGILEKFMRCDACGDAFRYSTKDIERNKQLEKQANRAFNSGVANALFISQITSNQQYDKAERLESQIIDYNKCPKCGSGNLTKITAEEFKSIKDNQSGRANNVSSADELKKFKELLDSGVITQEEFDAKKKQLLGL